MIIGNGHLRLTSVPPSLVRAADKQYQLLVNAEDASRNRWRLCMTGLRAKDAFERLQPAKPGQQIAVVGAVPKAMCMDGALFMFAPCMDIKHVPQEHAATMEQAA